MLLLQASKNATNLKKVGFRHDVVFATQINMLNSVPMVVSREAFEGFSYIVLK